MRLLLFLLFLPAITLIKAGPALAANPCLTANPNNFCAPAQVECYISGYDFTGSLACDAGRYCCESTSPPPTPIPPPPGGGTGPGGGTYPIFNSVRDPRTMGFDPPLKYWPCYKNTYPEFHPLRPYPGSPCDPLIPKSQPEAWQGSLYQSFSCGTSVNAQGTYEFPKYMSNAEIAALPLYPWNNPDSITDTDQLYRCAFCDPLSPTACEVCAAKRAGFKITLDLKNASLPVISNTQDYLDDATKVNNYLNWYLSGTNPYWLDTSIPAAAASPLPGSALPGTGTEIALPEYLDGRGGPDHDLSTGETIHYEDRPDVSGRDYFRMYKNANYEQFYLDLNAFAPGINLPPIGRQEDTSWAPLNFSPAHCTNGHEAANSVARSGTSYSFGSEWTPGSAKVGDSWTRAFQIVPIDRDEAVLRDSLVACTLSNLTGYPTATSTTLQLTGYWPANSFTFCTGITNPNDLIEIRNISGPGAGDIFYFMKGWGLVSFKAPGFEAGLMGPGAHASSCFTGSGTGSIDRFLTYAGPLKKLLPRVIQTNIRNALIGGPINDSYHNYIVEGDVRLSNAWQELFKYIPFSSLEDITSEITIGIIPEQQPGACELGASSPYCAPQLTGPSNNAGGKVYPNTTGASSIALTITPDLAHPENTDPRLYFSGMRLGNFLSHLVRKIGQPKDLDSLTTLTTTHQTISDHQEPPFWDYLTGQLTRNTQIASTAAPAPAPLYTNHDQRCSLTDVKIAPGDSLLGRTVTANLTYTQQFRYIPSLWPNDCTADGDECDPTVSPRGGCCPSLRCKYFGLNAYPPEWEDSYHCVVNQEQTIDLPTEGRVSVFTKTPLIDRIYYRLVAASDSLLRHFVPKQVCTDATGAIVPCDGLDDEQYIAQNNSTLPGGTAIGISAVGSSDALHTEPDSPDVAAGSGTDTPAIFFKHLGSLFDYMLGAGSDNKNFQRYFRPQGFGSTSFGSGALFCNAADPASAATITALQNYPKDTSCRTCGYSFASSTMDNVFLAASTYFQVPYSLLIAIFYNEGKLNSSGLWPESLTASGVGPGCTPDTSCLNASPSIATGPWNWIQRYFDSYIPQVQQALTAMGINDGRTPNRCNLLDATLAAAAKMSAERVGTSYPYTTCSEVTLNRGGTSTGNSCTNWSSSDIVTAARQYLGYCMLEESCSYCTVLFTCTDDPLKSGIQQGPRCYQRNVLDVTQCGWSNGVGL